MLQILARDIRTLGQRLYLGLAHRVRRAACVRSTTSSETVPIGTSRSTWLGPVQPPSRQPAMLPLLVPCELATGSGAPSAMTDSPSHTFWMGPACSTGRPERSLAAGGASSRTTGRSSTCIPLLLHRCGCRAAARALGAAQRPLRGGGTVSGPPYTNRVFFSSVENHQHLRAGPLFICKVLTRRCEDD